MLRVASGWRPQRDLFAARAARVDATTNICGHSRNAAGPGTSTEKIGGRFSRRPKIAAISHALAISGNERTVTNMWITILVLLVVWVVLAIVGFTFQGLLWLAIIGIVLFVATVIFGILRSRNGRRSA